MKYRMFEEITNIIKNNINYEKINSISHKMLRNCIDGVQLTDAVLFTFMYTQLNSTKDMITSKINKLTDSNFTHQSYENKANNIPLKIYQNIYEKIIKYYNDNYGSNIGEKMIAMDGTYRDCLVYRYISKFIFRY